jgi:excisionase family DNA binding protein
MQRYIIPEDEKLFTFKEAMGFLRVSRSTLYRIMWSGELQGQKVGSTWRFYLKDLRAVMRKEAQEKHQTNIVHPQV